MKSFGEFFKQFITEAEINEEENNEKSAAIVDFVLDDSLKNDFEALKDNEEFKKLISSAKQSDIQEAVKKLYVDCIESDINDYDEDKKAFVEKVVNFLNEKVQK